MTPQAFAKRSLFVCAGLLGFVTFLAVLRVTTGAAFLDVLGPLALVPAVMSIGLTIGAYGFVAGLAARERHRNALRKLERDRREQEWWNG